MNIQTFQNKYFKDTIPTYIETYLHSVISSRSCKDATFLVFKRLHTDNFKKKENLTINKI